MAMRNIVFLILIAAVSCKKRDCEILHDKTQKAWDDYEEASNNNKLNPSEENKKIAEEKYKTFEDEDNTFLNRKCQRSKYQIK